MNGATYQVWHVSYLHEGEDLFYRLWIASIYVINLILNFTFTWVNHDIENYFLKHGFAYDEVV